MSAPAQAQAITIRWNRLAASGAWLLSVFFTMSFVWELAPQLSNVVALLIAAGLQGILTLSERPLWRLMLKRTNGKFAPLGAITLAIDGWINGSGVYPFLGNLHQTTAARMLVEPFGQTPSTSSASAAFIAFLVGLLAAGLPEYLWEQE